jgi:hypothetical protein
MMIYSKAHYKHEMKKRNLIPYEECERLAEEYDKTHQPKPYDEPSPKALDIIRSVSMTKDKYGNIKLGQRAIHALREIGALPQPVEREYKSDTLSVGVEKYG